MNNEGGKTIIIDDAKAFLEHLSFWHNKSDDECIELATNDMVVELRQLYGCTHAFRANDKLFLCKEVPAVEFKKIV